MFLKDLMAKCKALDIKDYDTKQQIIEEDDLDDEPYCENEDLDNDDF